jgi:hypothetical protein
MLCVGMLLGTLRVPLPGGDAERHGLHSHAERGNDQMGALFALGLNSHRGLARDSGLEPSTVLPRPQTRTTPT